MPRAWMKALAPLILAILVTGTAGAQHVSLVLGTIEQPVGINEGDSLAPGTVIRTGGDALVIVQHRWQSDIPSRDCVLLAIFGYGQSYTASESATPGRCQTTVPNLAALNAGRPFLTRETRYSDPKFDEGKPPANVASSDRAWLPFDRWMYGAQHSFSGLVTSATATQIVVRSPGSGQQRRFAIDQTTVVPPGSLDQLRNSAVRVDWRITPRGPLALRIVVTAPPARENGGERGQVREPIPPAQPAQPDFVAAAPTTAERWSCTLDLREGGTGTLTFERDDAGLRGRLLVSGGQVENPVAGTWKKDRIEFWRTLSESSGQQFVGIAIARGDNEVRMAGRFAYAFAGAWSADCRRET